MNRRFIVVAKPDDMHDTLDDAVALACDKVKSGKGTRFFVAEVLKIVEATPLVLDQSVRAPRER